MIGMGKGIYSEDDSRICTVKDVYSSVTEVGTCGVSEAEISGMKKKALWLRQLNAA